MKYLKDGYGLWSVGDFFVTGLLFFMASSLPRSLVLNNFLHQRVCDEGNFNNSKHKEAKEHRNI